LLGAGTTSTSSGRTKIAHHSQLLTVSHIAQNFHTLLAALRDNDDKGTNLDSMISIEINSSAPLQKLDWSRVKRKGKHKDDDDDGKGILHLLETYSMRILYSCSIDTLLLLKV